ncbi:zinc finger protein 501-like [Dreissena polymorpha]|nr:zinc finger protein 501-like [Dreissena polymorpha]
MAQCSECRKMSKTRAGLLRHISGHANSGNYNCCGKAFQDAYNLRRLQRTKDPNVTCVYSATGALRTSTYSWLERKVQKEGLVKCYQCGLAVRSENDLREHVNTHMHDKCYSSEECFKTYKHKTNLSRYVRTSHKSVNND